MLGKGADDLVKLWLNTSWDLKVWVCNYDISSVELSTKNPSQPQQPLPNLFFFSPAFYAPTTKDGHPQSPQQSSDGVIRLISNMLEVRKSLLHHHIMLWWYHMVVKSVSICIIIASSKLSDPDYWSQALLLHAAGQDSVFTPPVLCWPLHAFAPACC